jgi:AcrR family transcriptional regulator
VGRDPENRRPSQRAEQKERTRRALSSAALDLFAAKGYGATTVDDITSAVGTSRATFYLHYDGKARIIADVYEDVVMAETFAYYRRLDTLLAEHPDDLRGWLDDALSFFERHRALLRYADEATGADPDFGDLQTARLLDRCAECMPIYLGRWSGPERELARLRLELLILQISHFARLWVDGHWPVKREVAVDVLLDLWGHALRSGRSNSLDT